MISWIQRYFQKHFRIVFIIVLVAVALPMVVIYSASGGGGDHRAGKLLEQPFFGRNLGNADEARRIMNDGNLSAQLRGDYQAVQNLQQYSLQRVAGLALADELHLPAPTATQVAAYTGKLRAFQNEQGQFDQAAYTKFGDALKAGSTGITGADVNRVLRDDYRLDALFKVLGGPGYVLPRDVQQQLTLSDSTWTVQVAALDYATFNPALNPTDDVLKRFHEENAFRYDVPVRPRLSVVEFKAAEFIPPVAPTEQDLRAFYNSNPARFPVPAAADKKDEKPDATVDNFPKVRDQVEAALKLAAGARGASKAANDLATALFEKRATVKANSAELTAFLAEQRRPAKAVAPFSPDQPPADMTWLGSYTEEASRLNAERFYSDPLPTPDSYAILLWSETLPGYKPEFAQVRERVLADYKETEKRKLFIARGQALRAQLQAAAKAGAASFGTAAAAEKLDVKTYASFSLRNPPQDIPYLAIATLRTLEPGGVSEMGADGTKGYLVYAQEKKLPDLTPANPRYAEFEKQMAAMTANNNSGAYLAELVEAELKKSAPVNARP